MNLDSIIDIASKWTFSTLSKLKHSTLYSAINNILSVLSKLKHVHFSVLDSLSKWSQAPLQLFIEQIKESFVNIGLVFRKLLCKLFIILKRDTLSAIFS